MALRRLTSLEAGKLQEEADQLNTTISSLQGLLADGELVYKTVKQESQEIADKYGDERRTTVRLYIFICLTHGPCYTHNCTSRCYCKKIFAAQHSCFLSSPLPDMRLSIPGEDKGNLGQDVS